MNRKALLGSLVVLGLVTFVVPQHEAKAEQIAYATGWTQSGSKWYFLGDDGYARMGWLLWNNDWYYLGIGGEMKTGWVLSDNKWYYFLPDGKMAVNTIINGFRLGSDGALIEKANDNTVELLKNGDFAVRDGNTIFYDKNGTGIYKSGEDGSGRARVGNVKGKPVGIAKNYLYFINYEDNNYLYRIKTDGSNSEKLSSNKLEYVKIAEGGIYYIDSSYLYKMDLDGNNKKLIAGSAEGNFSVVGDWVYYVSNERTLYRIKSDGTSKIKVSSVRAANEPFYIDNNYIFYNSLDSNYMSVVKTNVSNMETVYLNKQQSYDLYVKDGWVYYSGVNIIKGQEVHYIYSMKLDGSYKTQLTDDNSRLVNVVGEWIYYTADNGTLYRMRLDGTSKTKLSDDKVNSSEVYFIGDWIYYLDKYDSSLMYRIKNDGSGRQIVK